MTRLEEALRFTLQWEGGYVNDPDDPGGATMKGVTQATYDAWRAGHHQPKQAVRHISDAEVNAIYEAGYWKTCRCGALPVPVDLAVFDAAVNCGVGRACRWLQRALGVAEDGDVGPKTLAAAREYPPLELAKAINSLRAAHYSALVERTPSLAKFAQGWANRVRDLAEEIHAVT